MATKWSTPGIVFRETDNTVRSNAAPGNGRGAIVLNANKGYPNQRILNTSISDFYKMYGEPDNVNQYGHFASDVFFKAGSQQLLTVRATMGDEGYAQIQYPYTDASRTDINELSAIQQFSFVDNNLDDRVVLIESVQASEQNTLSSQGFNEYQITDDHSGFAFSAKAERAVIKDVFAKYDGDESQNMYVYRTDDTSDINKTPGQYIRFPTTSAAGMKMVDFAVKQEAYDSGVVSSYSAVVNGLVDTNIINTANIAWLDVNPSTNDYWKSSLYIPANSAVNGEGHWINNFFVNGAVVNNPTVNLSDICNSANLQAPKAAEDFNADVVDENAKIDVPYIKADVSFVKICDWDDQVIKSFTVETDESEFTDTHDEVMGVEYREYGMADYSQDLIKGTSDDVSITNCSGFTGEDGEVNAYSTLVAIAEEYGIDTTEITNGNYAILSYKPAKTYVSEEDLVTKIVKLDNTHKIVGTNYSSLFSNLFNVYKEHKSEKLTQVTVFKADIPEKIIKPWQQQDNTDSEIKVTKLIAMSTTEIMADSTGQWADGFTPRCVTEDEPGNGDIESYTSNQDNQLVIASYGPGEWGNDIGVSIITPEAAKYDCLNHANAFSWKYRYDDEDKVEQAIDPLDYENNPENLTWKKVYRINVYAKPKDKTSKTWGFGLDALTLDPIESWYVSNDPTAKDGDGNTLYAPYVINGKSNYIYVSKKSVGSAKNYKGSISMPQMTWSIYQLTGGSNSKLNNIKEKISALKLFEDRQKASFDILFNVEGVDTFNGKQRYSSLQRRIADIAAKRGMDVGVIQTTSREAKTIRMSLSEAKGFSFSNGSYVVGYAGYDSYYDSYTSNWIYLPKSVAGACAMCYCDVYSYPWMAPAGLQRGQISYSNRSNILFNDEEIGQLYDNNINASRNCAGYGEILWGQKTMLKKNSALNRVDVRRLLNYIEKNLEVMLVPFLFQKTGVNTRTSMKTTVDAFLSRIQSADGIINKRVSIVPDADDPHIVYVNINIVPAESIEWICVNITVDKNTGIVTQES